MKTSYYICVLLILGIGCTNAPTESITLSVLADKTDSLIPSPKISHVKSFLQNDTYAEGTRHFYFQNITDANVNASFHASISEADPFGNSLQRKAMIDQFFTRIDTLLISNNRIHTEYNSSSILKPLLMQLERVNTATTSHKVVLLYSDILEASDVFNVYNKPNQRLLLSHLEKVVELIRSQLTIPKLEGVHLYIIYYPTDRLNNRLFEKMIAVYKELFKDSGLRIHIGIDNQIH